MRTTAKISRAFVRPTSNLGLLSQREAASLVAVNEDLHKLFRRCVLAILNSGNDTDDARAIFEAYADFEVRVIHESRGV